MQNYLEYSFNIILNIFYRSGYRALDPEFGQNRIRNNVFWNDNNVHLQKYYTLYSLHILVYINSQRYSLHFSLMELIQKKDTKFIRRTYKSLFFPLPFLNFFILLFQTSPFPIPSLPHSLTLDILPRLIF